MAALAANPEWQQKLRDEVTALDVDASEPTTFDKLEAMHLTELRSGAQGHPTYRWVAQEMHRLIADQAGHRVLAEAMSYVDYGGQDLERLDSERRAEEKRGLLAANRITSAP